MRLRPPVAMASPDTSLRQKTTLMNNAINGIVSRLTFISSGTLWSRLIITG
jgi:hypothetical protein